MNIDRLIQTSIDKQWKFVGGAGDAGDWMLMDNQTFREDVYS